MIDYMLGHYAYWFVFLLMSLGLYAMIYIDPLPHTLMLTAIVVGVATSGVAFALVITIFKRYKTLNEDHLLKRLKEEHDNQ
jgi:NADH:ubiquinone oxidoreductase subunit K